MNSIILTSEEFSLKHMQDFVLARVSERINPQKSSALFYATP